jgi:hypothetical protein
MAHLGSLGEAVRNGRADGNRRLRRAGALAIVAAVSVLATACGGSSSSTVSSSALGQELAFAKCMRSNGLPSFPDPNSSGSFTLTVNGGVTSIDTSQAESAYGTCRHLLPSGGPSLAKVQAEIQRGNTAIQQADLSLLPFARCMHTHGEPKWPEPPETLRESGVNINTPQFQTAVTACKHLLPAGSTAP